MKKLIINGQDFEADVIYKSDGIIEGYIGDKRTFRLIGLNNISDIKLEDGDSFDQEPPSPVEQKIIQLEKENADLWYNLMLAGGS